MSKKIDIGAFSAYAIAVEHGYTGTEEEWVIAQEAARVAAESAAGNAANYAEASRQLAEATLTLRNEAEKAKEVSVEAQNLTLSAKQSVDESKRIVSEATETVLEAASEVEADKNTAVKAKDDSESARDQAVTAKNLAESAQGKVHEDSVAAQDARNQAVNAKLAAENAQRGAENAQSTVTRDRASVETMKNEVQSLHTDVQDLNEQTIRARNEANTAKESAKESEESAEQSASTATTKAQEAAESASEAEKTKEATTAEGEKQVKAIQDKGTEVLESIPQDYKKVEAEVKAIDEEIVSEETKKTARTRISYELNGTEVEVPTIEEFNKLNEDLAQVSESKEDKHYIYKSVGFTPNANKFWKYLGDGGEATQYNGEYVRLEVTRGDVYKISGYCPSNIAGFTAVAIYDGTGALTRKLGNVASTYTEDMIVRITDGETHIYVNGYKPNSRIKIEKGYEVKPLFSPLYGKKVTLNGDSIAYGQGTGGIGFMDYIATKYDMTLDKKAVSGGTISDLSARYPDKHRVCTTVDTMAEDADYIIFEGGYNDYYLWTQIGAITETMTDALDPSKFYGGVESVCRQALARWKGKKIGFVITHKINEAWRTAVKADSQVYRPLDEYYDAIRKVCNKYSIPYLDLSRVSRLNTELADYKQYTYNSDGIHPTEEGYNTFYVPFIEKWMEQL